MSKWKMRTPARRRTSICSPRWAKSAAYNDGSTSTVLIHSVQGTAAAASLGNSQARDEKPARPVDVRQRQQELRPPRVCELRPLATERLRLETRRIDHCFVLVGVDRADRVDDPPARTNALRRGPQQLELQLGQRLCTPAQIRASGEHSEARARRID